jgi:hypothetical protein
MECGAKLGVNVTKRERTDSPLNEAQLSTINSTYAAFDLDLLFSVIRAHMLASAKKSESSARRDCKCEDLYL